MDVVGCCLHVCMLDVVGCCTEYVWGCCIQVCYWMLWDIVGSMLLVGHHWLDAVGCCWMLLEAVG